MEVKLWQDKQERETFDKMDCPSALNRLATAGVPATVEHQSSLAMSSTAKVAQCVQNFITAMDSLKLNMVVVDQVHQLLSDLSTSLNKLTILPPVFVRLANMGPADELTEQQSSYNMFISAWLSAGA